MNITKDDARQYLNAITDAVRYANLDGDQYNVEKYTLMHFELVRRTYRSREMQDQEILPLSVKHGTDLGTAATRGKIKGYIK